MPFELREYTGFADVAGVDNIHFRYDVPGAPVAAERLHVTVVFKGPPQLTVHHYYHSTNHTWRVSPWGQANRILGAEGIATVRAAAVTWGNADGRQADAAVTATTTQTVPNLNDTNAFPPLGR